MRWCGLDAAKLLRHLPRAAAAPRPPRVVRRRLHAAGREGPAAGHAVAFRRGGHAVTVVTRLPAGLRRRGGWADTRCPAAARGCTGGTC